jgi:hypothetical protein
MTIPLTRPDLRRCFEGYIPATMASCSNDGVPNVSTLSQVHFIDEHHVALSRQFFNKTARNVAENPAVCIFLTDPLTCQDFRLHARFLRSETAGETFDRMKLAIDTVASMQGMEDVFALKAADIYEVVSASEVSGSTYTRGVDLETGSG